MNAGGKGAVILISGLAIAALLAAPAASQAERKEPAVERTPGRLWRLYPLDPEEGGKGQVLRTQNDARVATPTPLASDVESGVPREIAPDDEAGFSPWTLWVAITLACAAALPIILFLWRARWSAPAPATTRGVRTPTQGAADPSTQMPSEMNLVRVHLRDGRKMEGAVKHVATRDSPVLLLDVVDMSDAEGQKRDPQPTDAFVPLVEVERIESIDDTDAHGRAAKGQPQ